MRKREDNSRDGRKMFVDRQQYPSFSSTLLEKIYSSIDEGGDRTIREAEINKKKPYKTLQETCLLERNMMEKKADLQRRPLYDEMETKQGKYHRDFDHDGVCFSTSSCSSESSSGGFSSSESESTVVFNKTRASCFAPLRLKPVRTKAPEKPNEQSSPKQSNQSGSNGVLMSKELKTLEQLKKSKQPISPGGRLVNFINSLFSSSGNANTKRPSTKKTDGSGPRNDKENSERKIFPSQASSRSSVPSSVRSCLSKHPASTSDRVRDRPPRSVRFHPVAIVDETNRPCHGRRGGDGVGLVPVSVPKSGTMGRTQPRRTDQDRPASYQLVETIRRNRVEEHPKALLRDYQQDQTSISTHHSKGRQSSCRVSKDENDDDDDVISCSSSDLFELPVYETTRPDPSLPIY